MAATTRARREATRSRTGFHRSHRGPKTPVARL